MLFDRCDMPIALRRRSLVWNCRRARWNDDFSVGMAAGHRIVDDLAIIRTICCEGGNLSIDLVKQTRQFGHITDIVWCQFRGDNLMRAGVNPEMQFAPAPRRADTAFLIQPFALTVDLAKHI